MKMLFQKSSTLQLVALGVLCFISAEAGMAQTVTPPSSLAAPKSSRSDIAAKSDPSPFENNPSAVQSAQMQPSLATPFIVLQKVPEPKNKNAIPQDIYNLITAKKLPEAIVAIDKELGVNPRNVQLRFVRSRIQIELGQIDLAKKTLLEITQQFPELPEPYNNLAVLEAQTGNLDQAKEYLELALKVQPSFATALENLGDVYTRLASRSYGKAVQLDRRLIDSRRKMKLAEDILK